MKNALFALSAVAAVASMLAAVPASADSIANPFDVKIGGYFPYDSGYRNNAGDTFYSVGADYALKTAESNPGDTLGIYGDFDQSTNRSYNQVFGAGVQYKSDIAHNGKITPKDLYYALGIGYYWEQETIKISENPDYFIHNHGNELGGKAILGFGLTENVFVEGSYQYLPNDGNASGFGAQIGLRF